MAAGFLTAVALALRPASQTGSGATSRAVRLRPGLLVIVRNKINFHLEFSMEEGDSRALPEHLLRKRIKKSVRVSIGQPLGRFAFDAVCVNF
jgi:hypothetical protein